MLRTFEVQYNLDTDKFEVYEYSQSVPGAEWRASDKPPVFKTTFVKVANTVTKQLREAYSNGQMDWRALVTHPLTPAS